MTTGRRAIGSVLLAVLMLGAAACGSSSNNSTSGTDGESLVSSDVKDQAATEIDAAKSGEADWPKPTDSFAPGTGKAAIIACSSAAVVCQDASEQAESALQDMGWTTTPIGDAKYTPTVAGNLVDQAVQQGANVVIITAMDVNGFKSSVDKALAAGVQIGCVMCVSVGYESLVWDAAVDFEHQGELMGWGLINRGASKIALFQDKAYVQTTQRLSGAQAVLSENCSKCDVQVKDFSAADLGKPGPPQMTALLSANPSGTLTDVVAPYDGAGVLFAKTADSQGRKDLTVSGYDASPEAITALVSGKPTYGITVGEPYTYAAVAAVDLAVRAYVGAPSWDAAETLPSIVIDSDNAADYDGKYFTPSGDWVGEFERTWTK